MPKRRVYFYRIHSGLDAAGRPEVYDLGQAIRHINGLDFNLGGRYIESGEDELTCCWIERGTPPYHLTLGRIRRSSLPDVEAAGDLAPLEIPEEAGIAEQTHFVVFPDTQIVGEVFNFYGPRISALRRYLKQKFAGTPRQLNFEALLRQDVLDQLDQLGEIRVFDLRIRRSFLDQVRRVDDSLADMFETGIALGEAEEVEVILRPRAYSRTWLSRRLLGVAKRLANTAGVREEAGRFRVTGLNVETAAMEEVDVLRDRYVVEKEIGRRPGRGRALAPRSAFRAIREAYGELRDELVEAAAAFAPQAPG